MLWAFAQRAYVDQEVERPIIALWDETPGRGFPGYGWLFPGADGAANIGLGLGLKTDRGHAWRAVAQFDEFCDHLRRIGLLTAPVVDGRRLGGWLKMGMVGTAAARGHVFLVGDAAGLVNPLQGEGIAPAMSSAAAAADAILTSPGTAAARYRRHLATTVGRYACIAAPIHSAAISGSQQRVSRLTRTLTFPGVGTTLAAPWAVTWNDLIDGAPPGPATAAARVASVIGRVATARSSIRRRINSDLADREMTG